MKALARVELSIALVNDERMHRLNKKWRGKDKSTDVLSFPLQTRAELKRMEQHATAWQLGDVIISLDTAIKQAKEKHISLSKELEILLIHGILHLLGYDHELSTLEERRMKRMERLLLTR